MQRHVPVGVIVSVVALGIISVVQFAFALSRGNLLLIASIGLNIVLMVGLYRGYRWAYIFAIGFSICDVLNAAMTKPGAAIGVLFIDAIVVVPMLLSTQYFFGPARRPDGAEPLRCPKCGYILLGLTVPRCPECGERFEMPA